MMPSRKRLYEFVDGVYQGPKHYPGTLNIRFKSFKSFGDLRSTEGDLYLYCSYFSGTLGNIEYIGGDLNLNSSFVTSLGKLKEVEGDVTLKDVKTMKSLGNLERIGGSLDAEFSDLSDLGRLVHVGGDCKLKRTKVSTLSKLKYVGRNLNMPAGVTDFGKVKTVGGKIYFPNNFNYTSHALRRLIERFKKMPVEELVKQVDSENPIFKHIVKKRLERGF